MSDEPLTLTLDCSSPFYKSTEQRLSAIRDWMQGFSEDFPSTLRSMLREQINKQVDGLGNVPLSSITITVLPSGKWDLSVSCSLETSEDDQNVTPWTVTATNGINYDKLVEKFGSSSIDQALLERFTKVTGCEPHPWLRRGYFFSHRLVD